MGGPHVCVAPTGLTRDGPAEEAPGIYQPSAAPPKFIVRPPCQAHGVTLSRGSGIIPSPSPVSWGLGRLRVFAIRSQQLSLDVSARQSLPLKSPRSPQARAPTREEQGRRGTSSTPDSDSHSDCCPQRGPWGTAPTTLQLEPGPAASGEGTDWLGLAGSRWRPRH